MKPQDYDSDPTDSESEIETEKDIEKNEEESETTQKDDTSKKVFNALKQLHTSYNPTLNSLNALVYEDDLALVGGTDDTHVNPTFFKEAWHHPDAGERSAWRTEIRKEFKDMMDRNVWRHVRINDIPQNRRLIGNKWVFKKNVTEFIEQDW